MKQIMIIQILFFSTFVVFSQSYKQEKANYSLNINKSNKYLLVEKTYSKDVSTLNEFTLELSIKPETLNGKIIRKDFCNKKNKSFSLSLRNGYIDFMIGAKDCEHVSLITTYPKKIKKNEWNHITITYYKNTAKIYLNRKKIETVTEGKFTKIELILDNLIIGNNNEKETNIFIGEIDNLRLWNYAKKTNEITKEHTGNIVNNSINLILNLSKKESFKNHKAYPFKVSSFYNLSE